MWESIDQTVPESAAAHISILRRCPNAAQCQGSSDKQPLSAASDFHSAILTRVQSNSNTFKQLTANRPQTRMGFFLEILAARRSNAILKEIFS